ncbi:hypothetical protein STVA_41070 [Allostella vacuolata]|nr:hypothetical protein STVA_41070 [Stella vacuolata]
MGITDPHQSSKILWNAGIIVIDTNVVLDLYRLPKTASEELLSVLELLKEKLWIPHQVALEFQRDRLTVIAKGRKDIEGALSHAKDLVQSLKKKVDDVHIDKYGIGVDSKSIFDNLEAANSKLIEAIEAVHGAKLDITSSDPIRDRLDLLFFDKVGAGPFTQENMNELIENGESRYAEKIPPGFSDAEKEKNPESATFNFKGIRYQRKFGDLILWRQIINYARDNKIKNIVFVTADSKVDWWWREHGKTIGPRPELIHEIASEASVELFWMYSSSQFMDHAKQYASAEVSEKTVADLEKISDSLDNNLYLALKSSLSSHGSFGRSRIDRGYEGREYSDRRFSDREYSGRDFQGVRFDSRAAGLSARGPDPEVAFSDLMYDSVYRWLGALHDVSQVSAADFPDFIATKEGRLYGY